MEKSISELKAKFMSIMCGGDKKNDSFEIHVIILRYIDVNLPCKKDFKFVELLTKTFFFLYRSKVCAQK